jgi:hypothetical protein
MAARSFRVSLEGPRVLSYLSAIVGLPLSRLMRIFGLETSFLPLRPYDQYAGKSC